ncbi:MAG: hypothetical protein HMLIMOIP_002202 [Candidatus Nitrosomirales archaeon]|jgi:hypothetical protein
MKIVYIITITLLLLLVATNGQTIMEVFGARDTIPPTVTITKPIAGAILPPSAIRVEGTALDNSGGSGIKIVHVSVDGGTYAKATPKASGDWSNWSISVSIVNTGYHKITVRATDNGGNKNYNEVTIAVSSESPNDLFGVKKIYVTENGSSEWYMNTDNILDDTQFSTIPIASTTCTTPKTCTLLYKNTDSTWHAGRMNVSSNEGIRMVVKSPSNDLWLNTEMTGYYKLTNSMFYPQEFIHLIRSGSPHASTCEGASYYAGITYDGDVAKIQKSLYFGGDKQGYSQTLYIRGVTTPLTDRWIGMKTVTYNINSNTAVQIEIWIDDFNDNNWRKVFEKIDNGWTVPGDPSAYGCINPLTGLPRTSSDIILWGGSEQQFRADNAEMDFKWLSIREIVAPVP